MKGLNTFALKIIAITSMLIDHVGAVLFPHLEWMRIVGRLAFPIFAYLLVEGFFYTKDVKKYMMRLGLFALISEVPFDLAFFGTPFVLVHQNVFFTLLCGLLTMIVFRYGEELTIAAPLKWFLCGIGVVLGAAVAEWLSTDYGAKGVLCIMVLYLFRKDRHMQILAGCASFLWEWPALFGFIPIACYNGRRGMKLKYFFYAFSRIAHKHTYSKCGCICKSMGVNIDLYPTIEISNSKSDNQDKAKKLFRLYRFRDYVAKWRGRAIRYLPILNIPFTQLIARKYKKQMIEMLSMSHGGAFHCVAGPLEKFESHTFDFNPFEQMIELDFEGYKFMAPAKYHQYLSHHYGDYMQLPPENQRQPYHCEEYYWK
jgi:hypothetical protein